jgi:hypothetical protein
VEAGPEKARAAAEAGGSEQRNEISFLKLVRICTVPLALLCPDVHSLRHWGSPFICMCVSLSSGCLFLWGPFFCHSSRLPLDGPPRLITGSNGPRTSLFPPSDSVLGPLAINSVVSSQLGEGRPRPQPSSTHAAHVNMLQRRSVGCCCFALRTLHTPLWPLATAAPPTEKLEPPYCVDCVLSAFSNQFPGMELQFRDKGMEHGEPAEVPIESQNSQMNHS